ncbi:MAG TPA: hypothetical protein VFZ65_10625 [Planctomycetota bacterium]|nr:hypothetical protein [Planctomycetota bacterium]
MSERNEASGPDTTGLSLAALQQKRAMLPGLLGVVRRRRRRRHAARITALLVLVAAPIVFWRPWRGDAAPVEAPVQVAAGWTSLGDDPTVLARCEVLDVQRREWFVDDEQLRQLLAGAARESGIVRVGGRVFVAAAAIDEWSSDAP